MPEARVAASGDLTALLDLFAACEVSPAVPTAEQAEAIWQDMLAQPGMTIVVADEGTRLVATCTLITAPNLLREGRCHAFLENVATRPDCRREGYGRAVVGMALDRAWREGCHQVLLQSGRTDPGVHAFYRSLGFIPGLRTAYAVHRP